ncbi:MAG: hypothetical protein GX059_08005 [Clostridiales bacterium]|jgi:hypothetical protein|nr:hypothetical protein [Clostridiales bacterium]
MKHKNADLVPQIFLAVVGVILTGMIIYYVINSAKATRQAADAIIAETLDFMAEYSEHDIRMYDGEEIRGAEVVNFIKKHLGDYGITETAQIFVEVITRPGSSTVTNRYVNREFIDNIRNFSDEEHYIKPTAVFRSEVIVNANKVITGVRFIQK